MRIRLAHTCIQAALKTENILFDGDMLKDIKFAHDFIFFYTFKYMTNAFIQHKGFHPLVSFLYQSNMCDLNNIQFIFYTLH